jgi:hypothetical protein
VKFKDVYKAVMNKREKELSRTEMFEAVTRQIENVNQQQEALKACVFGRKRVKSGRGCKMSTLETHGAKYGPWMNHLEADRVLNKFDTVYKLWDRLSTVKKHLGIE